MRDVKMITKEKNQSALSQTIEKILFDENDIKRIVESLAERIENDYRSLILQGDKFVVLGLLNGSVQFMADLVRKIDLPLQMQFIFTSSYGASTVSSGEVQIHTAKCAGILDDPTVHILVIEDIVDSGNTLSHVMKLLSERNNKSVKLCALFDKPSRRVTPVHVDYIGETVPDEFIVGYGLDYNENYRNLPYVGVLKREVYEK